MRVRLLAMLIVALALVAGPASAQSVTGTAKVGVNFSKLTTSEDDGGEFSSSWKSGLAVGAGVDVPITPLFSFAPEFLYTMKGGKGGDFGSDDNKLKADFIQIPLLFKASFAGGSARPFVTFGPAIAFTTGAKFEEDGIEEDVKDDVETVDFSGIVGVGVQFGRGILEARYDHGFRDLTTDSSSESKLKTFTILFGVSFGG